MALFYIEAKKQNQTGTRSPCFRRTAAKTVRTSLQEPPVTRQKRKSGSTGRGAPTASSSGGRFSKPVKEKVYGMTKEESRQNASDRRMDAFHRNLRENCEMDAEASSSPAFQNMMKAISSYSSLSLRSTASSKQSRSLQSARPLSPPIWKRIPATKRASDCPPLPAVFRHLLRRQFGEDPVHIC